MIFGIGADICEVRRLSQEGAEDIERLPIKILTPAELAQWRERLSRNPDRGHRFLATRFAAKEALGKALGLGLRHPMGWQSCEVRNNHSGQPEWILSGDLLDWCEARELRLHLSLSDEVDYVLAYCIAEHVPAIKAEGG
jgi:holo-[acyl-carrier protein] synthase